MNEIKMGIIGSFIIILIICVIWIKIDYDRIEFLQNETTQLSSDLHLQNNAIENLKNRTQLVQSNINNAERENIKLAEDQRVRSNIVIKIPEIEDCKAAIKWGAIQSSKIAKNWI